METRSGGGKIRTGYLVSIHPPARSIGAKSHPEGRLSSSKRYTVVVGWGLIAGLAILAIRAA